MHYISSSSARLPLFQSFSTRPFCTHLPASVSTVDDDVRTRGVRASVADKVDVSALELLGLSVAAHGDHAHPEILNLLVHKVGETGVDVAGGDGVDAGKVAPFVGQAKQVGQYRSVGKQQGIVCAI